MKRTTIAGAYGSPQYQHFDTANACGEMSVSNIQNAARYTSCGELERLAMDEAEKKIIQERIKKEKEADVPYWDCTDGAKGSRMSQFSTKTLESMKGSLQKARNNMVEGKKYYKPYMKNIDAKLDYINKRLAE